MSLQGTASKEQIRHNSVYRQRVNVFSFLWGGSLYHNPLLYPSKIMTYWFIFAHLSHTDKKVSLKLNCSSVLSVSKWSHSDQSSRVQDALWSSNQQDEIRTNILNTLLENWIPEMLIHFRW